MTLDLSVPSTSAGKQSATETVRDVGAQTARAGRDVAGSVKEQGEETLAEATRQARNLYGKARGQLTSQAGEQQRRAAGGLRSLAEEMRSMAEHNGQSGPVSEFARQSAEKVHLAANWLEKREPGDLLTEVRGYAKRNPGPFLVGAALLGVVAGRLIRNLASSGDQHPAVADHPLAEAETAPLPSSTGGLAGVDASTDGPSATEAASQIHPTPGTLSSADETAVRPSPSAGARI